MALVYFSRIDGPAPGPSGKFLVSGVVEADSLLVAKVKLEALLFEAGATSTAAEFDFRDLATVERLPHGVLVITMGEAN